MTSYTHKENGIARRLLVKCRVAILGRNIENSPEVKALWDTGANCTCISTTLAKTLGLMPDDCTSVIGANNQPFDAPVYSVQLKMGEFSLPFLRVIGLPMDGQEHDVIIGMDVMTKGDLSISNYNGRTVLTFREPSIQTIDYVQELEKYNVMRTLWKKKGIDTCPCGSRRRWSNCHGKS